MSEKNYVIYEKHFCDTKEPLKIVFLCIKQRNIYIGCNAICRSDWSVAMYGDIYPIGPLWPAIRDLKRTVFSYTGIILQLGIGDFGT